jgi:tetratricopeptide (TPR) repeat protein
MTARPVFWMFLLLLASGLLAVRVENGLGTAFAMAYGEPVDPLSRLIGSAKEAVGDTLFIKADSYFHGGVNHDDHRDESREDFDREGVIEEGEVTVSTDWIARINSQVRAHELKHLEKDKRKEMLPYFMLSSQLDPYNIEAVLTTAFWLDHEFGKTDQARELLEKGLRDNPTSWEIPNSLAQLSEHQGDKDRAEKYYRDAVQKAPKTSLEEYEWVELYYRWAEILNALGRAPEALDAYQKAAEHYDIKTGEYLRGAIADKIKELSATA